MTIIPKIGPIEVLDTLGAGAKSNVLLVRRLTDGKEFALKLVPAARPRHRKYLSQLRQEYRVGLMLDHPSLVKHYCLEIESDWLFRPRRGKLLLEYIPGRTLDLCSPCSVNQLIQVFHRVACGVAHMHACDVVHGDLKPNNIIVGPGVVKVIDFGLARVNGESSTRLQGTPEYMAPETFSCRVVNERTDIFNLGATMLRSFTGRLPPEQIAGLPLSERVYRSRLVHPCELNPRIPEELGNLIVACLCFAPRERPASAKLIGDRLAALVVSRSPTNA